MRNRWIRMCFIFFVSIVMTSILSATVSDLTVANVKVPDRSEQSLQQVMPQALEQVLVKLSGNSSIASIPNISQVLSSANNWMQGFSYKNTDNGLHLLVNFNSQPLYRLLRQAGQTIWSNDRPQTLIWVDVIPLGQPAELLVADSQYTDDLQQSLSNRGLASMLPIGDLDDQSVLDQSDIWPPPSALLTALQARYGAEALSYVVIRELTPGQWKATELLLFNKQQYNWTLTGTAVQSLLAQTVDNIADTMANQLAVLQAKNLRVDWTLRIQGINNLASMQSVMNDLNRLTVVDNLRLVSVDQSDTIFKIETASGRDQLRDILQRTKHLSLLPLPADMDENTLILKWRS